MAIFLRWETERKTDWSNNAPFEGIAFSPPSRIKILFFFLPFCPNAVHAGYEIFEKYRERENTLQIKGKLKVREDLMIPFCPIRWDAGGWKILKNNTKVNKE